MVILKMTIILWKTDKNKSINKMCLQIKLDYSQFSFFVL